MKTKTELLDWQKRRQKKRILRVSSKRSLTLADLIAATRGDSRGLSLRVGEHFDSQTWKIDEATCLVLSSPKPSRILFAEGSSSTSRYEVRSRRLSATAAPWSKSVAAYFARPSLAALKQLAMAEFGSLDVVVSRMRSDSPPRGYDSPMFVLA